jgi:hypothetical protein
MIAIIVVLDALDAILSRSTSEGQLPPENQLKSDSTLLPTPHKNNVDLGLHASHCL